MTRGESLRSNSLPDTRGLQELINRGVQSIPYPLEEDQLLARPELQYMDGDVISDDRRTNSIMKPSLPNTIPSEKTLSRGISVTDSHN